MANMIQRSVVGSTVTGLVPNTVIKCNISNGIADCNTTQMTLSSNKQQHQQRFDPNLDQLRAIRADLESQRFSYDNGMWKEQSDCPLSPFAALSPIYNSFESPQAFLSLSPSSSDSGLSLLFNDASLYDGLIDDKPNKSVGDEITLNKMMIDDEESIDLYPMMSQFTPPPSNFLSESSSAIVSPAASTSESTWESSASPASSDSSYSSYSPKPRQRQQQKSKRLVKKPKIVKTDAVRHFPKPKKCIHIREFLLDLLLDPSKYNATGYAKWLNMEEGLFYVVEPEKVAALWAKIKSNRIVSWKNFTRSIRSAGEDNGDFETVERRQGYGKWYVVKFGDRFRAQNELYKQALLMEKSEC